MSSPSLFPAVQHKTTAKGRTRICTSLETPFTVFQPAAIKGTATEGTESESLSLMESFTIPWTILYQAPLSMEFSRQEYKQAAISFSGGSSQPRDQPASPALAGRCFTTEPPRKPTKGVTPRHLNMSTLFERRQTLND